MSFNSCRLGETSTDDRLGKRQRMRIGFFKLAQITPRLSQQKTVYSHWFFLRSDNYF